MHYIDIGQFVAMVTHGHRNATLKRFTYLQVFSIPDWGKLVFECVHVYMCVTLAPERLNGFINKR
jgi:hypothetical protein